MKRSARKFTALVTSFYRVQEFVLRRWREFGDDMRETCLEAIDMNVSNNKNSISTNQ